MASVVIVGEDRATQDTLLLGRVEFAIFASNVGAFDHKKSFCGGEEQNKATAGYATVSL